MSAELKKAIIIVTFFIGFSLLLYPVNITGNAVGVTELASASQIIGVLIVIASAVMLATANTTIETKVEDSYDIEDRFRKWAKKNRHTQDEDKITNIYRTAKRSYELALKDKVIRREEKPLDWIEKYVIYHDQVVQKLESIKKKRLEINVSDISDKATRDYIRIIEDKDIKDKPKLREAVEAYVDSVLGKIEKNAAQMALDNNHIPDKRSELERIARECGYTVQTGDREGPEVYTSSGDFITTLTKHLRIPQRDMVKGMLRAMATAESNYRPEEKKARK